MASFQPQLMTVQDLFRDSIFRIPDYQRTYSWEQKQWNDLWEDIREGIRTGTSHFLGTVVLMAEGEPVFDGERRPLRVFQVVDGQQRMTSLCLLLLALYRRARVDDERVAGGVWRDFVEPDAGLRRLHPGGLNEAYFAQVVQGLRDLGSALPEAERSTNRRIRGAVLAFQDHIDAWLAANKDLSALDLASYVRGQLQVLRFVTDSRPLAIKTFQTVNDRGKELSLLDKTKSFLMFYVTRYLEDDADAFQAVEDAFGRVFDSYDAVKDLASHWGVDYFLRPQFKFDEDEFLRYAYHYGANDLRARYGLPDGYEYGITAERVFDRVVKGACRHLRNDTAKLRSFILDWCGDLVAVAASLVSMLARVAEEPEYARFFRFQGPSASVYPLLVGACTRGILDARMLQAISILDLRVYKVRNTDPKADLYRRAVSQMKTGNPVAIHDAIVDFCHWFGNDGAIDGVLRGPVYREGHTRYVLWRFAVADDLDIHELDYDLFKDTEQEHILPDDPSTFDVTTFGFTTVEEYVAAKGGYGNLTLLEGSLNRKARNAPPGDKAPIYADSKLAANRLLGTTIGETGGFRRPDQVERTDRIVAFFRATWPIPAYADGSRTS